MAIFGKNNFGSPLGAIDPQNFFTSQNGGVYSYSGFSNALGAVGFSGACSDPYAPALRPPKPILTYPLNFDRIGGTAAVTWRKPTIQACEPFTYEIQLTRSFSRDVGWRTIVTEVPSEQQALEYNFALIPSTPDCGLRIRSVDSKGLTSDWSSTVSAFSIADHVPYPVKILAPIGGETFDNDIVLVWREADIKSIDGRAVTYKVQITPAYTSDEGWIDVPNASGLLEGTSSYTLNAFGLPEGNDYGVQVITVDNGGNESPASSVGPFTIMHNGVFVIDTTPPMGSMTINDGEPLTKDVRVKLDLFGFDATTGVKEMRLRNADEDCWGSWDAFVPERFWDLSSSDGLKRVYVQLKDYANNVSEACDCEIVSRVLCGEGNVTDLEVFNNKLYVSFDENGNVLEYRALVRSLTGIIQPQVTAMAKLQNALYISAYDEEDGRSSIYRYDNNSVNVVVSSLSGKITTMTTFLDRVYVGYDDGKIYSFDGVVLAPSYSDSRPIKRLRADGFILYASLEQGSEYLTYNGSIWVSHAI